MKTFVICNEYFKENNLGSSFSNFVLENENLLCGLIDDHFRVKDASLEPNQVLIRTKAFSCNFRDRGLMLYANYQCRNSYPPYLFSPIGSEFVGEVIMTGRNVTELAKGDRVIGDNTYPIKKVSMSGVPTNYASQRYHIFNYDQVIKIPENLPDEKAAAFSIGAQTSYSMIRKLKVKKRDTILITAGTSNTSLFALMKLRNDYSNIYVITTRKKFYDNLRVLGAKRCITIDELDELSDEVGGFDVIIDPFFDIYLYRVSKVMNQFARYTTCGLYNQHPAYKDLGNLQPVGNYPHVIRDFLIKNMSLIGNCIGLSKDIQNALTDFRNNMYDVVLDSIYTEDDLIPFLERSYKDPNRFGKVVYKYAD